MKKRMFDIIFSLVVLLVLAPLFAFIAVAVKFSSSGPVLYRQVRLGRGEAQFFILKFRTMIHQQRHVDQLQVTSAVDVRITKIGRILRKYKLDELPQFLNVLIGQMSVVGPRPEVPKFLKYYSNEQRQRIFYFRPGITDFSSLVYRDEEHILAKANDPEKEYVETLLPQKLQLQALYFENQSLLGDLLIIWKTFLVSFFRFEQKNTAIRH